MKITENLTFFYLKRRVKKNGWLKVPDTFGRDLKTIKQIWVGETKVHLIHLQYSECSIELNTMDYLLSMQSDI